MSDRYCKPCGSPRSTIICFKCGADTFIPCDGWSNPKLPPIDKIRSLAMEVGYSIGLHGSQERDLDLIAAPWTEDAIGNQAFCKHIESGLGAKILEFERKPHGRVAASIQMDGYYKIIDLSVMGMA